MTQPEGEGGVGIRHSACLPNASRYEKEEGEGGRGGNKGIIGAIKQTKGGKGMCGSDACLPDTPTNPIYLYMQTKVQAIVYIYMRRYIPEYRY